MEVLHLSYDEVVFKIPYRNLIIMQKDKLHTVYGDVLQEVNEEEFFELEGKGNPFYFVIFVYVKMLYIMLLWKLESEKDLEN